MRREKLPFSSELSLPLDMATETLAFLGRKGRGKTYGAQRLFELLFHAGVQCVALDPVGNWWALRVGKDGKGPGLPVYVFGGPHGDVPILPDAGAFVARVIVEKGASVILDVSRFRKAERKRFMTAFAEEFFHLKKDATSAVHLFVEEAHKFVPQIVRDGEEQMLGAMEDIIRIGRNYGIGASLISQRSASVNKDVLSQVECLVAYQTGGKQDKKAIVDWVEENDEEGSALLSELKSLQQGEALLWSPAALRVFRKVHVTTKETYDASSTPKVGGRARKPVKLAPVDLRDISEAMQKVVKEAEASDVGALKHKIAEQTKLIKALEDRMVEMGKAAGIKTMPAKATKEVVPIIPHKQLTLVDKLADKLLASQDRMNQAAQAVVSETGNLRTMIKQALSAIEQKVLRDNGVVPTTVPVAKKSSTTETGRTKPPSVAATSNGETEIDGPMRRMLGALQWFRAVGVEAPSAVAVAFMAGYSGNNGTFRNVRGKLHTAGLITYPSSGHVSITATGERQAESIDVPATNVDMHRVVLKQLDGPQSRMLEALLNAYPRTLATEELCFASGYEGNNGTFRNVRGRLHTYGLIEYPDKGTARAADILFPEGGARA